MGEIGRAQKQVRKKTSSHNKTTGCLYKGVLLAVYSGHMCASAERSFVLKSSFNGDVWTSVFMFTLTFMIEEFSLASENNSKFLLLFLLKLIILLCIYLLNLLHAQVQ